MNNTLPDSFENSKLTGMVYNYGRVNAKKSLKIIYISNSILLLLSMLNLFPPFSSKQNLQTWLL